jgi:hypothetical protein
MSQIVEEIEETTDDIEEVVEEVEEVVEEAADQPDEESTEEAAEIEEEEEEIVVSIGEESLTSEEENKDEQKTPEWVKEVRAQNREQAKENKRLREELEKLKEPVKQAAISKKPTLESYDYDAERFEEGLEKWYNQERKKADAEREMQMQQEEQAKAWNKKLEGYEKRKKELKVKDYSDAEEVALHTLNDTQQAIILEGAEDPALMVYAIGKNAKRAKELSEIKDPIKFAWNLAKLEKDLKVQKRTKAKSQPEKTVKGNGSKSGVVDSTLKRLEAEADKTGNRTKVAAYKRQLRNQGKK